MSLFTTVHEKTVVSGQTFCRSKRHGRLSCSSRGREVPHSNLRSVAGVVIELWARSQNCEKRLLASLCLSVRPSVRPSFLPFVRPFVLPSVLNGTNSASTGRILKRRFIRVFFFQKSVGKIQVLLKSVKNNGYFTWRRFHIYDSIL